MHELKTQTYPKLLSLHVKSVSPIQFDRFRIQDSGNAIGIKEFYERKSRNLEDK